jgi:PAS domain S-box-containing protein
VSHNTHRHKNSRLPIWLTTIIVIIMIILFSMMINEARERESAEQYGRQSMILAKATAAGIEDLFDSVEKNLLVICRYYGHNQSSSNSKSLFQDIGRTVKFMARQDASGRVSAVCHPLLREDLPNRVLKSPEFVQLAAHIKKTRNPSISDLVSADCAGVDGTKKICELVIIGVPNFDDQKQYTGSVFAALSLPAIIERFIERSSSGSTFDALLADGRGNIMIHHRQDQTATNTKKDKREKFRLVASLKNTILEGKEGYGEYDLPCPDGRIEKSIVAHAPIRLNSRNWSMVISTPYYIATSQIKKTFRIVMLEALVLIATVMIGSALIIFSSRKRFLLEEELRLLQERNRWREQLMITVEGLVEGSPIPTFVINKEHTIIFWNKACAELTGYDSKSMVGTDLHYKPFYREKRPVIADLIIDRDIEGLNTYYAQKAGQKSVRVEGAYEALDYFGDLAGKSRYLYFLAAPIYNKDGEIIAVIETLQDVTNEQEMAKSLQENAEILSNRINESIRLRQELEELYNHIQTILDSSPDLIFSFNKDGIINYISRRPSKDGESKYSDMKGKHVNDIVVPEYREFMRKKWDEEITKGIHKPFEITVTTKSGSKRNLLITSAPIKGTDHYLIVQRDITEYKTLEEKFYESQKLAAVGQLSAGIAHEVRNPLSSIKMSLQILEKRLKPDGNDLKRFNIARKEVEHLEKIVNDILTYAKPTKPEMKSSDIGAFLESSLMMAENEISQKKIKVHCDVEPGIPLIKMDSGMLMHALLNIYLNAIDAMKSGGILSLKAKLVRNGNRYVSIEIEDNGSGIDEGDISQIFNPFFTRKGYGTGLGLTHVKKFIDLHHGTIAISSKKGEGTKVVVTLPIEGETETL